MQWICNDSNQPFDLLKTVLQGSLEKVNGSLILSCFVSPWKCRASSPAFSWEIEAASSSWCQSRHQPLFVDVFDPAAAFHERGSKHCKPQKGRSDGYGCKRFVRRSPRPQPYWHSVVGVWLQRGRRTTRGAAVPIQKVVLLPLQISFICSTLPTTTSVNTTVITAQGPTAVFPLVPDLKTEKPPSRYMYCLYYTILQNCGGGAKGSDTLLLTWLLVDTHPPPLSLPHPLCTQQKQVQLLG